MQTNTCHSVGVSSTTLRMVPVRALLSPVAYASGQAAQHQGDAESKA